MKTGRLLDLAQDGLMVAVTAIVGVIVIGKAIEFAEPTLAKVPFVGSLLANLKAAVWTVYNP